MNIADQKLSRLLRLSLIYISIFYKLVIWKIKIIVNNQPCLLLSHIFIY